MPDYIFIKFEMKWIQSLISENLEFCYNTSIYYDTNKQTWMKNAIQVSSIK